MIIKEIKSGLAQDPNYPDRIRGRIFVQILEEVLKHKDGETLVDLGAGHCLFSIKARDHGYDVTAVDARTERLPAQDVLGNIKFVHSNINDFDTSGYDVVANLGLFYHLSIDNQFAILEKCNRNPFTILETQVHNPNMIGKAANAANFSGLTTTGQYSQYTGVHYVENNNPTASIGNTTSFWHTEESMLIIFEETGYKEVILVAPVFMSKYGMRRFYVLVGSV